MAGERIRILSGIQPSGDLHIGNYFGMMRKMVEYQQRGEVFAFIVNMHSLTSVFDGQALSSQTLAAATDFLALGLDPEACHFWVQSDVPEVAELTWYLSNSTPLGLLQRGHAYKDKVDKGIPANTGLFTYPVLMAADILAYQSKIIPVGQDQKQHVEMARDIAIKFNNSYGETFVVPVPEICKNDAIVPGVDGKKMSKSYGNTIEIFGNPKAIRKKVMRIITDSTPVEEPKNPETCNVFALYKLFAAEDQVAEMEERYRRGGYGYGEAKKALAELLLSHFAPYQDRWEELKSHPDDVRSILKKGADRVRPIALETMEKVRSAVGMIY